VALGKKGTKTLSVTDTHNISLTATARIDVT
jgi:hypothetical protein